MSGSDRPFPISSIPPPPVPAVVVIEQNNQGSGDKRHERKKVHHMEGTQNQSNHPIENLERSTGRLRGALDRLSGRFENKSKHGMKIVAGGALLGGTIGGVVTAYTVPKAGANEIMLGTTLGAAGGALAGAVVNEMIENGAEAKNEKKKQEESRS